MVGDERSLKISAPQLLRFGSGGVLKIWRKRMNQLINELIKRDAGNPIFNTLCKTTSDIFLVCNRPTGIFLQSQLLNYLSNPWLQGDTFLFFCMLRKLLLQFCSMYLLQGSQHPSYKGVRRTAPATLGLLKIITFFTGAHFIECMPQSLEKTTI